MARKKIQLVVYLEPQQVEDLKRLSTITRVPVSVYVRDGVDAVLVRHADKIADATVAETSIPVVPT